MVIRLLLFLLAAAGGLGGLIWGARRALRPLLEARQHRRLGALNAAETCSLCYERAEPAEDFYDRKSGRWTHARCMRQLLD